MPRLCTSLAIGLLACGLAALPAVAQTSPPPAPPGVTEPEPAPGGPGNAGRTFVEEFRAANTTHDGRLTLQQAQAAAPTVQHMGLVARRFAAIDTQHKGYITLQDIRAYRQEMMQQRAAHNPSAQPATNND
jgi:hypothetical protein